MKQLLLIFCTLLLSILLFSCGSTRIITNQSSDIDIYINGVNCGKNEVKITRSGAPHKINIEAKYNGQLVGQISEKRYFTFSTFLVGYCTYGLGLILDWKYPLEIIIPINTSNLSQLQNNGLSQWDKPNESSVWNKPLSH
jgi:hypothetical protein